MIKQRRNKYCTSVSVSLRSRLRIRKPVSGTTVLQRPRTVEMCDIDETISCIVISGTCESDVIVTE